MAETDFSTEDGSSNEIALKDTPDRSQANPSVVPEKTNLEFKLGNESKAEKINWSAADLGFEVEEHDPNQLTFDEIAEFQASEVTFPKVSSPKVTAPKVFELFRQTAPVETPNITIEHSVDLEQLGLENEILESSETIEWQSTTVAATGQQSASVNFENALDDEELRAQIKAIPNKLAFKIGDVAEIVDVKQYVLRYWETEFEVLKPKKSKFNQRMYSRRDVEMLLMIKKLLYRDRFSTEGARMALKKLRKQVKVDKAQEGQSKHDQQMNALKNSVEDVLVSIRELRSILE